MGAFREVKRRSLAALVPAICFATIAYFGYHAAEGDHGIHAYSRLAVQIQDIQVALSDVTQERKILERRVSLLRQDRLDLDMLEEQGHRVLGLLGTREMVILDR